jgi:hypothetical protein
MQCSDSQALCHLRSTLRGLHFANQNKQLNKMGKGLSALSARVALPKKTTIYRIPVNNGVTARRQP